MGDNDFFAPAVWYRDNSRVPPAAPPVPSGRRRFGPWVHDAAAQRLVGEDGAEVSSVYDHQDRLIAVETVLFLVALRSCLDHWRRPEYTLFWRHATSW